METSSKVSNLRRELVNTYGLTEAEQQVFIDIQNEVSQQEWIKMDYKNVPPEGLDILVVIELVNDVTILKYSGNGWIEPVTGHKIYVSVTHWMPKPKLPQTIITSSPT